jgi:hypothetical protein
VRGLCAKLPHRSSLGKHGRGLCHGNYTGSYSRHGTGLRLFRKIVLL